MVILIIYIGFIQKKKIDLSARFYLALKFSCQSGNLKLIKWFYNKIILKDNVKYINNIIYQYSSRYNHLHILNWLYSLTNDNNIYNNDLLYSICESGSTNMLEWLYSIVDNSLIDITIDNYYCLYLIPNKSIYNFLGFLLNKNEIPLNIIKNLLTYYCKINCIEILKFINNTDIYDINFEKFLLISSGYDSYKCVKYIINNSNINKTIIDTSIRLSISNASINTLKYLNNKYSFEINESDIVKGFNYENIKFNTFLVSLPNFKISLSILITLILKSCYKYNVELFIFYYDNLVAKEDINSVVLIVTLFGNLEMMKYIYDKSKQYIDFSIYYNTPFYNSINANNLELSKWIQDIDNYDVSNYDNYALKIACDNGYIKIVEWLLSFDSININVDNDYPFRAAILSGNINLCKLIYNSSENNIDIKYNQDEAFRKACEYKFIDICEWLVTLDDRYILELNDNRTITNWNIKNKLYDLYNSGDYDNIIKELNLKKNEEYIITSENQDCLICYSSSEIITNCNHSFCKQCFFRLLVIYNEKNCPYCRQDIQLNNCILLRDN